MGDVKVHLVAHVHSCAVFGLSGFMDDVMCVVVQFSDCQDLSLDG